MKAMSIILIINILVFCSFTGLYAQYKHYTKSGGYAACISEEYLDDFVKLTIDGDKKAMQKMLDNKVCFILKAGIPCYVMDTSWLGKVKIRPEGFTLGVWTVTEAIKEEKNKEVVKPKVIDKIQKSKRVKGRESCYELGRRYGRCFSMGMAGLKCDPKDDISIPPECRNNAKKTGG